MNRPATGGSAGRVGDDEVAAALEGSVKRVRSPSATPARPSSQCGLALASAPAEGHQEGPAWPCSSPVDVSREPIAFIAIAADTTYMTAVYVSAERPGETEISMASEVLPHVREYLANHHDDVVRLEVTDDHETLNLPRSAVELLARVLAHMAAGQGSRSSRPTPSSRLSRRPT